MLKAPRIAADPLDEVFMELEEPVAGTSQANQRQGSPQPSPGPSKEVERHGLIPIFKSCGTLPPNSWNVQVLEIGDVSLSGNIRVKISDSYTWIPAEIHRKWTNIFM